MAKKVPQRCIPLLLAVVVLAPTEAAEFSAYVALTSDYVYRGVTQTDGDPAVQLGGDLIFDNGWFVGLWGSTVDIDNGAAGHRDLEVNYYLGYAHDLSDQWQLTANVVAYQYPGTRGTVDYDSVEYSLTANYDDRAWVTVGYTPDLFHSNQSAQNIEVYAEWPFGNDWALGGGGGYYDVADLSNRGYGYWQLGLTRYFAWADIDLRYHDANRWASFVSSPDRVDARLSLTVRIPF